MKYKASSPDEYIAQLPEERQEVVKKLRAIINKNIPKGFEETIIYDMIGYVVPHRLYPEGYHCSPELPLPFINLASQKNFVALYHSGVYALQEIHDWFVSEYPKHAAKKLDMGKSCIRFKNLNDIPYNLIGELVSKISVEEWINHYESVIKK